MTVTEMNRLGHVRWRRDGGEGELGNRDKRGLLKPFKGVSWLAGSYYYLTAQLESATM